MTGLGTTPATSNPATDAGPHGSGAAVPPGLSTTHAGAIRWLVRLGYPPAYTALRVRAMARRSERRR